MELEQNEFEELTKVLKWKESYVQNKNNSVTKFTGKIGKFINPTVENIKDKIPKRIVNVSDHGVELIIAAAKLAIEGFLNASQDLVKFTYDKNKAVKKFKKREIDSLEDLYKINVSELEKIAESVILENNLIALVEGGATGFLNIFGATIDIPAFLALTFRVMQQIASCYGYDPDTQHEKEFIMGILSFSVASNQAQKQAAQLQLQLLKVELKRAFFDSSVKKKGGIYAGSIAIKDLANKLGMSLTKKEMADFIPILGSVLGGFFNYGFIRKIALVANNVYKERFLEDKKEHAFIIDVV